MRWLWRVLGGGVAALRGWLPAGWLRWGAKLLSALIDSEGVQAQAKASVAIAAIEAELESRKRAADLLVLEHGWWVTRWIRPLFAYPLIIYFAAVVADKLLHLKWEAEPLPEPLDDWAGWIVTAYFLVRGFEKSMRWFRREETK